MSETYAGRPDGKQTGRLAGRKKERKKEAGNATNQRCVAKKTSKQAKAKQASRAVK
jgi:hypothetical protein